MSCVAEARRGIVGLMVVAVGLGGCAVRFSQRSPWDIQQLQALSEQLEQVRSLAQLKAEEADRLREAKELLEKRLSSEIADHDVSVGFDERGLVVRVLDRVLFDSGKAELRAAANGVLDKVSRILREQLPNQPISIEGHTDNEPIRHSGWKDNWELSLARARAVLTYLINQRGFDPSRVAAAGYGEYRPLTSNDTPAGRQQNRRVEIVALPQRVTQAATTETSSSDEGTSYRK